jgi:hypothetical protein
MKLKKKKIKVKNKKYYNNFLIIVYMGKKHTFKRILKQRDNIESERDGTTTEEFAKLLNSENHHIPNRMQQTFGMPANSMQQTFGMPANSMQQTFDMPANSMQQTFGMPANSMQQTFDMPANSMQQTFDMPANSMQQTVGMNTTQIDPSIIMAKQQSVASQNMPHINGAQTMEIDPLMSNIIAPVHNMGTLNNLAKLSNYQKFDSHAELSPHNSMINHDNLPQVNNMIGGGSTGIHNLAKLNKKILIKKIPNFGITNLAKLL